MVLSCLREDTEFHGYQTLEAGIRQFTALRERHPDLQLLGLDLSRPSVRHMKSVGLVAAYLFGRRTAQGR